MSKHEFDTLRLKVSQEKDRADYFAESCKKYLQAYENCKKDLDIVYLENERLKVRLGEIKEISMAKEANYEMINHLGSLDQEYYQDIIERLRNELNVVKEENRLLNELNSAEFKTDRKSVLNSIKSRQEELLNENHYLSTSNDLLNKELHKKSQELEENLAKYKELLTKQLEQAKVVVAKEEEIKFWKCTLIELLCGEVLNNFTKEEEFSSLVNSSFDLSEKFLRIKDKLVKNLKMKHPQILNSESEALISEKSFIIACAPLNHFLHTLSDAIFETNEEISVVYFTNLNEKVEVAVTNAQELFDSYQRINAKSSATLINFASLHNLWILDLQKTQHSLNYILNTLYYPEKTQNCVRQGLLVSESIYLLIE